MFICIFSEAFANGPGQSVPAKRRRMSRKKNDQPVASQSADKTSSARSAELISPSAVFDEELTDEQ